MPLTLENFHPQTDFVLHPHVWNMPHGSPELGFTGLDFSLISMGRKGGSHWDWHRVSAQTKARKVFEKEV